MFKIIFNFGDLSNWLVAIGTILLAFITVFQDRLRAWLMKPKIELKSINFTNDSEFGHLTHDTQQKMMYFHIKVINQSRWKILNCQIKLSRIKTYDGKGELIKNKVLDVPVRFQWALSDLEETKDIIKSEVLDFCFIVQNRDGIGLCVKGLHNFDHLLKWTSGFDLFLDVAADNYFKQECYYVKMRVQSGTFPDLTKLDLIKERIQIELIKN